MFLQSASTTPSSVAQIIGIIAPILVPIVAVPIYDAIQKAITFLNKLPVWATRVIVALLIAGANLGTQYLGITFPTTIAGINPAFITTFLGTILAYFLKHVNTVNAAIAPKPPQVPVVTTNAGPSPIKV